MKAKSDHRSKFSNRPFTANDHVVQIRHAEGQAHYYSCTATLGSLRFDDGNVNDKATNQ